MCITAAVFQIKLLKGSCKKVERKKREDKGERGTMASDDAIKKLIGKSKSIEAVTFLEKELKKDVTARLDEQVYRRERS